MRVSSAEAFAASCQRARRSLVEIAARDQADQHAEEHERSAELYRWHDDDQAVEQQDAVVDEPVLEHDAEDSAPW